MMDNKYKVGRRKVKYPLSRAVNCLQVRVLVLSNRMLDNKEAVCRSMDETLRADLPRWMRPLSPAAELSADHAMATINTAVDAKAFNSILLCAFACCILFSCSHNVCGRPNPAIAAASACVVLFLYSPHFPALSNCWHRTARPLHTLVMAACGRSKFSTPVEV